MPGAEFKPEILVLGIYLADRANAVEHLVSQFARSQECVVDQKWVGMRGPPPSDAVAAVTARRASERMAKFTFLNYLCATTAWRHYDYLLLSDDDITLPEGFVDRFIELQRRFHLALAQPARTHNSYIEHPITEQVDGVLARETRFVEIGPVVSIRRDLAERIVPFDEGAPMGWGLDLVWAHIAREAGFRIGIIDAVPVDHSLRAQAVTYDARSTNRRMEEFLRTRPHLTFDEARVVLASYRA